MKNTFSVGLEFSREQVRNRGYAVDTTTGTGPIGTSTSGGCTVANVPPYNCTGLYNPNPDDPWSGSIGPAVSGTHTVTLTKAVYGFNTIELNDQFSLNFGVRYDMYDTDQETWATTGVTERSNHDKFFNYSLGAVYKPLPNGSIYVSYGTSSNPSGEGGGDGSSTLAANNTLLKAEENRSFEVGTKWDFLNQRLATSFAVFQIEKKNARVASTNGTLQSLDGEQRVRGFEFGVSGSITPAWKIFGGYTYLDSEITDGGPTGAATVGNPLPNTPTHSGSVWSTYSFLRDFQVGGGATYVGPRWGNTTGTREVPGYWKFDAMGSYRYNEHVSFQLNVLNIFDKEYFDKPYTAHFATVGAGRTALLTTAFKF
jgi:catecholate siderophore receptor